MHVGEAVPTGCETYRCLEDSWKPHTITTPLFALIRNQRGILYTGISGLDARERFRGEQCVLLTFIILTVVALEPG